VRLHLASERSGTMPSAGARNHARLEPFAPGQSALRTLRPIALFLPQFHPIPENDAWWGKGFTEWTNVSRARPLFLGHVQPRLPGELGFYDLRLPEVREAQATLARAHGVEGFCYYHYWFLGKRLLAQPIDEILESGKPDFPFCLAWANESWSRRWLGEERDVLMPQDYSAADDHRHSRWLARTFADPRYLTVGGRPLFVVYRPRHLPQPHRTTDLIREACAEVGLAEPYLVGSDAHCPNFDARLLGFDDTLVFAPQLGNLRAVWADGWSVVRLIRNLRSGVLSGRLQVFDYHRAWRAMAANRPTFPHLPCAFVGWDNTPRRGMHGLVLHRSSPQSFLEALREARTVLRARPTAEKLIFLNAWNEWAEGAYLEPDLANGRAYLETLSTFAHEDAS
jgi:hypothetical protein